MPPQSTGSIIREKKVTHTILVLCCGIVVVLGVVFMLVRYQSQLKTLLGLQAEVNQDELIQQEIDRIMAEGAGKPFIFKALPNAREIITLPPPPESNASDTAVYTALKYEGTLDESTVQNDVAFNLPFMGVTYSDYLNSLDVSNPIYQMIDELHELTLTFNEQYKRPALIQRIEGVNQMAPLDPIVPGSDTRSVYPSIRAVDAYAAAEVMSRIDPDSAASYQENTDALVARGIGYGLYGASDAEAAKSLIAQYMTLYTAAAEAAATQDNVNAQ